MMRRMLLILLALAVGPLVRGQAPVISSGDMFNEAGLYYRAYGNYYDALVAPSGYPVGDLMKSPGPDQYWDFSVGPSDRVLRFEYLDPTGIAEAADFPQATMAERKTVEGVGEVEWLFFEQVPALGRRVYGIHSESFSPGMPSVAFQPPVIDFPDTMAYQDAWITSFVTESTFPSLDPEWDLGFMFRITWSSTFTVDAWGVAKLPDRSLVDVLRINEEQVIGVEADLGFGDGYEPFETDYVRSYYWLSPGRGIVAQMTSTQGQTMPPLNFTSAVAFVRMFETNKKGTSGSTDPQPVEDLSVTVSNGKVLIEWSKAQNATSYQVQYSTGGLASDSWQSLNVTSDNHFFDPEGFGQRTRFYRVLSLR